MTKTGHTGKSRRGLLDYRRWNGEFRRMAINWRRLFKRLYSKRIRREGRDQVDE